ncbi:hypothetical protein V6N11_015596 [Hibiscus sabdariffa]|uniref:FLZ-type domain-containing protein n=1 Tax=Hibiscus sabdariffa TaxID=183260 RepID=A0ABR2TSK1_9ROSI
MLFETTPRPHCCGPVQCAAQVAQLVDSVAQWIRRWSTEPEILGSIPIGVGELFPFMPGKFRARRKRRTLGGTARGTRAASVGPGDKDLGKGPARSCVRRAPLFDAFVWAGGALRRIMSGYCYYYSGCQDQYDAHYLDACSLCRKSLHNSDIFMYRGNTPFCSQECRQEQMEIDEAREKNWKSGRSLRKSDPQNSTTNKTVRTGTVAVA